jgi:hypothetical protein
VNIHRLYTDEHGESHFEDVEIEDVETTRGGRLSQRLPRRPTAVYRDGSRKPGYPSQPITAYFSCKICVQICSSPANSMPSVATLFIRHQACGPYSGQKSSSKTCAALQGYS